jgi:hypothetical protein
MAVITGTLGNDEILGTPQSDVIDGLDGEDIIRGGAGDDQISGGAGDDTIYVAAIGGIWTKTVIGNDGTDTLFLGTIQGGVVEQPYYWYVDMLQGGATGVVPGVPGNINRTRVEFASIEVIGGYDDPFGQNIIESYRSNGTAFLTLLLLWSLCRRMSFPRPEQLWTPMTL